MHPPIREIGYYPRQKKYATAADLPVELLGIVVKYVGTDDRGQIDYRHWKFKVDRQELANCSLVCLNWAKRCRRRLFEGMRICIKSLAELQILETYFFAGSPRLVPVVDLVLQTNWEQNWESWSWCYKAVHSPLRKYRKDNRAGDESECLTVRGPVPTQLPRSAYRSPHWSLPRSMPACYLPFRRVNMCDIRFPHLSDLVAFTRHLNYSTYLTLEGIRWGTADIPASFRRIRKRRGRNFVRAQGCQDNALACIVVYANVYPSLLPYMGSGELAAYIDICHAMSGMGFESSVAGYTTSRRFFVYNGRDSEWAIARIAR